MATHHDYIEKLPAWVNQTLEHHEYDKLTDHIDHCQECKRQVGLLKAVQSSVQTQDFEAPDVDLAFNNVMRRIDEPGEHSSLLIQVKDRLSRACQSQYVIPVFASVLACVIALPFYLSRDTAPDYQLLSSPTTEQVFVMTISGGSAVTIHDIQRSIDSVVDSGVWQVELVEDQNNVFEARSVEAPSVDTISRVLDTLMQTKGVTDVHLH